MIFVNSNYEIGELFQVVCGKKLTKKNSMYLSETYWTESQNWRNTVPNVMQPAQTTNLKLYWEWQLDLKRLIDSGSCSYTFSINKENILCIVHVELIGAEDRSLN